MCTQDGVPVAIVAEVNSDCNTGSLVTLTGPGPKSLPAQTRVCWDCPESLRRPLGPLGDSLPPNHYEILRGGDELTLLRGTPNTPPQPGHVCRRKGVVHVVQSVQRTKGGDLLVECNPHLSPFAKNKGLTLHIGAEPFANG